MLNICTVSSFPVAAALSVPLSFLKMSTFVQLNAKMNGFDFKGQD